MIYFITILASIFLKFSYSDCFGQHYMAISIQSIQIHQYIPEIKISILKFVFPLQISINLLFCLIFFKKGIQLQGSIPPEMQLNWSNLRLFYL